MSHARLGPSNHRWPHCPGSVREEARFEDIPGEAAIDGTGSHLLLEMCLLNGVAAAQYDQQIIGANHPEHPSGWLIAPDRIERVQMALNYITRRVAELKEQYKGCTVTVTAEVKSDPGGMFGRTDWWGTCDITIKAFLGDEIIFLEVADYKDGRGWVDVRDNTQLLSYLGGQMRPYIASGPELVRPLHADRVPNVRMTIIQPKTNPVIRSVCSTRYEDNISSYKVVDRLFELELAADRTDRPDAPLIPGKWCQWCKANPKRGGDCMADVNESISTIETTVGSEIIATDGKSVFEFIGSSFSKIKELTNLQLADLADAKDSVMAGFQSVEDEIQRRIEDEKQHVPGYAMGFGNDANVWAEPDDKIEKMLKARRLTKDEIFPSKLISPAQVMKLTKLTVEQRAKIEKDYIKKVASKKQTLKKVARTVEQSLTNSVESVELMFGNLVKPAVSFTEPSVETKPAPITFF